MTADGREVSPGEAPGPGSGLAPPPARPATPVYNKDRLPLGEEETLGLEDYTGGGGGSGYFPTQNRITFAQAQGSLAIQPVEAPALAKRPYQAHRQPHARPDPGFFPQQSETGAGIFGTFVDPFPDFRAGVDREAGGEPREAGRETTHPLNDLDATAFEKSDNGGSEVERPGGFKESFEENFNPGFESFGDFGGAFRWGSQNRS